MAWNIHKNKIYKEGERMTYKVDKDFTWDKYFKQVGIYQGRSHWTTVKKFLLKLMR